MNNDTVRRVISQYIASNWTSSSIVYDKNSPIPDNNDWIRINILNADSLLSSIGSSKVYRQPGVLIIEIYTEQQKGSGAGVRSGDTIATLFRGQKISGVSFLSPTVLEIGQSGAWYQVNVEIPFRWDMVT